MGALFSRQEGRVANVAEDVEQAGGDPKKKTSQQRLLKKHVDIAHEPGADASKGTATHSRIRQ